MVDDVVPWLDADEMSVWRTFIVASQGVDAALDRQLQRDADMAHSHYAVLVTLSEAPDRTVRMGELARRLHFSSSRLAHAVTRMEARGWVTRERCADDRRGQLARLTDRGAEALRDAAPGHVALVRRIVFDPLDRDEQAQLRELFDRISVAVRAFEEEDAART